MKFLLPLITLLLAVVGISRHEAKAQIEECGTDQYTLELQAQFPELVHYRAQMEAQLQHYLRTTAPATGPVNKPTTRLIPVVVHLITETGGGGLTDQEIEQGIAHMNDDFRGLNSDTSQVRQIFKNLIADSQIEFRLARIDPQGNCTRGIVRIASPLTNNAQPSNAVKSLSYWPADRYFNIWLVKSASNPTSGGLNGYAQFPGTGSLSTYGVVVRIDRFGLGYTNGIRTRTLTHEVGHCLNLYHMFQSGCGSDCATSGDQVCDTPPSSYGAYTCSPTLNTCTNDMQGPSPFTTDMNDQYENYLAYGECRLMFTHGQKARMLASLDTYSFLQNLSSPANALATGIANPQAQTCAPMALFSASITQLCSGASITFTDHSYNATPDNSWSWSWNFPGGTPSASVQQHPVVQYNTPGTYPVTLTVTNAAGTDSHTQTSYISVWPAAGETAPYSEGFEAATFPAHATDPDKNWLIEAPSSNTWARYTNAAAGGSASLRIRNSLIPYGYLNSVISPAIDLSGTTGPVLSFDVAYAMGSSAASDRLKVYLSADCGQTWALRYNKAGQSLSTMGTDVLPQFEPTEAAHWRTETIAINNQFIVPNLRIKFEGTSGVGNSIFLDNINLGVVSGMAALPATAIALYPNPAGNQVVLQLNLPAAADISCRLTDVTGREVLSIAAGRKEAGTVEIPIWLEGVAAGVYVLQVSDGSSVITRKLVKQ